MGPFQNKVKTHKWYESGHFSLSEVYHKILDDPDHQYGSSSNKCHTKARKIDERCYFICTVGVAIAMGVKFVCIKGQFEPGNGLRSNYHIQVDPELVEFKERPNRITMRQF